MNKADIEYMPLEELQNDYLIMFHELAGRENTRDEPSKFGGSDQYFKLHFKPIAAELADLDVFVATSQVFSTKSKLFGFAKQMSGAHSRPAINSTSTR